MAELTKASMRPLENVGDSPVPIGSGIDVETDRMWTTADVRRVLNISPRTVWAWIKSGKLPQPVRLGSRKNLFSPRDVLALLAREVEARDAR